MKAWIFTASCKNSEIPTGYKIIVAVLEVELSVFTQTLAMKPTKP